MAPWYPPCRIFTYQSGDEVLDRVAVDGGGGDGGDPLVVHLVDVLVEGPVVQQPEMGTAEVSKVLLLHSKMQLHKK